eukprot:11603638-Alexandrium_andersonii.AAC.1
MAQTFLPLAERERRSSGEAVGVTNTPHRYGNPAHYVTAPHRPRYRTAPPQDRDLLISSSARPRPDARRSGFLARTRWIQLTLPGAIK